VEFDASELPAVAEHWKRDYFFYANGYVKDMDWWDASPFTVAQLPFHKMSTYPYADGEKFPDDADAFKYQLDWNDGSTRVSRCGRTGSITNGCRRHQRTMRRPALGQTAPVRRVERCGRERSDSGTGSEAIGDAADG